MELNELLANPKKQKRRKGRGHTRGRTCGRGNKGQKSRSGGGVSSAFEGGQTQLQRRLPKVGFRSRQSLTHSEIKIYTLQALAKRLDSEQLKSITMKDLRSYRVIRSSVKTVKVILSGEISLPIHLRGIPCTAGAIKAIEAAGGSVTEEVEMVNE